MNWRVERQREWSRKNAEYERARIAALPLHHRHGDHRNPNYISGPWFCCAAVQLGMTSMDECNECGESWPCAASTANEDPS